MSSDKSTRLRRAEDRRLLQAAAAARESTGSPYVAQVATDAARRDLLATRGDQASERVGPEQRA